MRLLDRNSFEYAVVDSQWPAQWNQGQIEAGLGHLVETLIAGSEFGKRLENKLRSTGQDGGAEYGAIFYTIDRPVGLIIKKCYGIRNSKVRGRVADRLCRMNMIPDCNKVNKGDFIHLPKELLGHARDEKACPPG